MDDLRATIETALTEAGTPSETPASADAAPVSQDVGSSESVGVQTNDAGGPPRDGAQQPNAGSQKVLGERARDASGRFAPKGKEAQAQTQTKQGGEVAAPASNGSPPPAAAAAPVPAAPPAESIRPPSSLTPAEREHFAKAPVEVQKAFARLDVEVRRTMQEAAPLRRFQQEVSQALAPIAQSLQARGVNPAQAIANFVQYEQQLSSPDPVTKARAAALIIKNSGVDIQTLAAELDAGQGPAPQQPAIDPASIIRQAKEELRQEIMQHRQQSVGAKARAQVEEFAANPEHEFFEDVWAEMAGFVDAAKARGVEMSLKDAYDRAVWANPEIRAILQQREMAKSAVTANAATQRASAAGSSVRNQPASPVNGRQTGNSIRADLEASIAMLNGR